MRITEELGELSVDEQAQIIGALSEPEAEALLYDWPTWARPQQLPPATSQSGGPWAQWLYMAGRGAGKTRSGAEWIRSRVCGSTPLTGAGVSQIAIIAETAADMRSVLIEGESGLLAVHSKDQRPIYSPSNREVRWQNGARALLYNGTEPDQLRGPQFHIAWVDELAKMRHAEMMWDMLQFCLRLGENPQAMVTTTPRPIPIIRKLLKDPTTAITRGSMLDNQENLAESFVRIISARYQGTRLGRQELDGEVVDDDPHALWQRERVEQYRIRLSPETMQPMTKLPTMRRIVVSIDPATSDSLRGNIENAAETGIVVVALGEDNIGYVLEDCTTTGSPEEWARTAFAAYRRYSADLIVAESNQGGEMVGAVMRAVAPLAPFRMVRATRAKVTRAEPVAALYHNGRVRHVGVHTELEEQMFGFSNIAPVRGQLVDRVDALVWACTELFPSLVAIGDTDFKDKWAGKSPRNFWTS